MMETILVCDGGMGTGIHSAELGLEDFENLEGCNEVLVRSRPDVIKAIHRSYFEAGADCVETNTFGATPLVLGEFGIPEQAYELNRRAATIAREVADELSTDERPRFVLGSVGPTTRLVSLGHIEFAAQLEDFETQISGLIDGGVDGILIETCQDILQVKSAVIAARRVMKKADPDGNPRREVPILVQVTVETTGTMLVGTDIAGALTVLESLPVDVIGLNCATGPDLMVEHVRYLSQHSTRLISVQPNAGLPQNIDGKAVYRLTPAELAAYQRRFVDEFGVGLVGGCCGTTPAHTEAMAEAVAELRPKPRPENFPAQLASLYSATPLLQETGPLLVGERTNANGSKKFREMLLDEDWDGIVELAKGQVAEGAHVLDVCVAYVGRDEVRDMTEVLSRLRTAISIPIMIDSTQIDVMEAALQLLGGRPIINSINLEDSEEKFDKIAALASEYGAALVALTIDEEGMAKLPEQKLECAQRMRDLAVERHGLKEQDLIFDPLTFTIAQGEEDSRKLGLHTLDGIALIREAMPAAGVILGLSNISFGLKAYPRQILNSVYLGEARERGLTSAILNAKKIIPTHRLDDDELQVTTDLIYDRRREGYDPLFAFIERFTGIKAAEVSAEEELQLSVPERIKRRIIDGNKVEIGALLDEALKEYEPLQIINEFLLDGMRVVGELFGSGKMQLPFVLQSAEAMKAAVSHLEPYLDKIGGPNKGSIVIATVKGDVHDIGKNLVDIILSNNGYVVHNLGIKQPIDNIIAAIDEHQPSVVGLSGLLVKSTVVMKDNLERMRELGKQIPVICGGAALTRGYVEHTLQDCYGGEAVSAEESSTEDSGDEAQEVTSAHRNAPLAHSRARVFYARDAFDGLQLMDEITGQIPTKDFKLTTRQRRAYRQQTMKEWESHLERALETYVRNDVGRKAAIPKPPFWGTRVVEAKDIDLAEVFRFVNLRALFSGQWQYRRRGISPEQYDALIRDTVEPKYRQWCQRIIEEDLLEPKVVYGYFPCQSEKNDLIIYDPEVELPATRIRLPRQLTGRRLCIADFFRSTTSGERDVIAMSVVTMGQRATENAQALFAKDLYDDYLHYYGLGVEAAEALAEMWHKRIRQEIGIAHQDGTDISDLFKQHYQGSRYSFGYPACPRLEEQAELFKLLRPDRIGVSLTEEFQLVPEQSTSAIIVHHPEAKYFNV
jgi:5-methyltetrahydrofolate--homocysteine methyltransferase